MSSITISDLHISEENFISELSETELSVQGGFIFYYQLVVFAAGIYIGLS